MPIAHAAVRIDSFPILSYYSQTNFLFFSWFCEFHSIWVCLFAKHYILYWASARICVCSSIKWFPCSSVKCTHKCCWDEFKRKAKAPRRMKTQLNVQNKIEINASFHRNAHNANRYFRYWNLTFYLIDNSTSF